MSRRVLDMPLEELAPRAGLAAATIANMRDPHMGVAKLSVIDVVSMAALLCDMGLDRPDLLPGRAKPKTPKKGGL